MRTIMPKFNSSKEIQPLIGLAREDIDKKFQEILILASNTSAQEVANNAYNQYHHHLNILAEELHKERPSLEVLISLALKYFTVTRNCLIEINNISDDQLRMKIHELIGIADDYIEEFSDRSFKILSVDGEKLGRSARELFNDIETMHEKQNLLLSSLNKNDERLNELEKKIGFLSTENNNLYKLLKDTVSRIDEEYSHTLEYLAQKKKEVDDVVGLVAGKSVAGSYEISASEERSSANWLRGFAILFMVIIVGVIGYTLIESVKPEFSIEVAVLRISFALILSIPAAYLARESAKHRQQQYTHLQTSLDLKAITPYIASLPSDTQDRLKEEMASRIFSQKNFDHITKETYPINTHEIVMALIEKFDAKEKFKNDSKVE